MAAVCLSTGHPKIESVCCSVRGDEGACFSHRQQVVMGPPVRDRLKLAASGN